MDIFFLVILLGLFAHYCEVIAFVNMNARYL